MKEWIAEVSIMIDDDEIDDETKVTEKKVQIRRAIEGLDSSIGVFTVDRLE